MCQPYSFTMRVWQQQLALAVLAVLCLVVVGQPGGADSSRRTGEAQLILCSSTGTTNDLLQNFAGPTFKAAAGAPLWQNGTQHAAPPPSTRRRRHVTQADDTLLTGTYIVDGGSANFFDPVQLQELSSALSVPAGYGNENGYVDVPLADYVEFGWQYAMFSPPPVTGIDISKVPAGFLITWTEFPGESSSRGHLATVTLTSASFTTCATITRTESTFPEPIEESLSGNTITLTTADSGSPGQTSAASWLVDCQPRVRLQCVQPLLVMFRLDACLPPDAPSSTAVLLHLTPEVTLGTCATPPQGQLSLQQ